MNKNFNVLIPYDDIETAYTTHKYPNAECMVSDTNDVPSTNFVPPTVKMIPKRVTENGTYYASQDNADGYDEVVVDVEGGSVNIEPLTARLTENGRHTFAIEEGVDGYYPVEMNVDVQPRLGEFSATYVENGQYVVTPPSEYDGFSKLTIDVDVEPELETKNITANGTYTPSSGYDGFSSVTVSVQPDMPLNSVQISSISNKYMGAISTSLPIEVGYYAISHYNSDQSVGSTNLSLVKISTLPTTLNLTGLSNFRLNVTSNSVEVDNYDGSSKDVYMSIMKIPDNAICVKPD